MFYFEVCIAQGKCFFLERLFLITTALKRLEDESFSKLRLFQQELYRIVTVGPGVLKLKRDSVENIVSVNQITFKT